jgi:hypothetical protein
MSRPGRRLVLLGSVVALALIAPASADTTYAPPYQPGPRGGDEKVADTVVADQIVVDPAVGRVTVVGVNTAPGAVNCGGGGPFAYLRVNAVGPATTVSAAYTEAAVDPYAWIKVLVKDAAGNSLAPAWITRGPVAGDGVANVTLERPVAEGEAFTVDVGLEVASACPNADGGTVRFTGVTVG